MNHYTACMHFEDGTESDTDNEDYEMECHPQKTYRTDYTLLLGKQQKEFLKTYQWIDLKNWRMLAQSNHTMDWSYVGTTNFNHDHKARNENIRKNYKHYWP